METCNETKDDDDKTVNLITVVIAEPANIHDSDSTFPTSEAAEDAGFKPETLLGDTAYGADTIVEAAKEDGVEVISPAGGEDPEAGKLRLADFNFDNDKKGSCPEGQKPWATHETKRGKRVRGFDPNVREKCPKQSFCPVDLSKGKAELSYTMKELRLSRLRAREQTDAFKKRYARRSGI
jgi:hypothetical protein